MAALLVTVPVLWLYPILLGQFVKITFPEGSSLGLLGKHTLVIENEGLRDFSAGGEMFSVWPAIHRISETENLAAIYLSPTLLHVIPKRKIVQGDLDRFLAELRRSVGSVTTHHEY